MLFFVCLGLTATFCCNEMIKYFPFSKQNSHGLLMLLCSWFCSFWSGIPSSSLQGWQATLPGWLTVTCLISSAVANSLITAAALKPSRCCQPLPELHQVHQVQPAETRGSWLLLRPAASLLRAPITWFSSAPSFPWHCKAVSSSLQRFLLGASPPHCFFGRHQPSLRTLFLYRLRLPPSGYASGQFKFSLCSLPWSSSICLLLN